MDSLNKRLLSAARDGEEYEVLSCIERGANVNCIDGVDQTALHEAAWNGQDMIVVIMVEMGTHINAKDYWNRTALHLASQNGHDRSVEILVQLGADVFAKDTRGSTPLHCAVSKCRDDSDLINRREKIAAILIKAGSDLSSKNNEGKTPFDYTDDETRNRIIKITKMENTPVNYADDERKNEIITKMAEIKRKVHQIEEEMRDLGINSKDDFLDIMKQGSYKCFWNRVYLVGPYGVGKSTLAKVLVGEEIPMNREATDGIWIYMGRAGMDLDQKCWKYFKKGTATFEIISKMLMTADMEIYDDPLDPDEEEESTKQMSETVKQGEDLHLEKKDVTTTEQESLVTDSKIKALDVFTDEGHSPNDVKKSSCNTVVTNSYQTEATENDGSALLGQKLTTASSIIQKEDIKISIDETGLGSNKDNSNEQIYQQVTRPKPRKGNLQKPLDQLEEQQDAYRIGQTGDFEPLSYIQSIFSYEQIYKQAILVLKEGKYKQKIIPIDIWDFGGQKDYYMTHQLFITSRGIFVLMFNGSVDIHKHMSDLSFLPGHFGKPTIAVYLLHWVNSILTYCKCSADGFPRIVFVATHKDKIPKRKIEKQRQTLVNDLREMFKDHPGIKHLEFDSLFFINARDAQDEDIQRLQELLMERAYEHPRGGEEMPSAWVPLEWRLAKEAENGKNIISKIELDQLNSNNQTMILKATQIETFLKVQHSLGKLLYFDTDNLRDFIIINPAYLVEVLRSIVTEKQFWPIEKRFNDILVNMQKKGEVTRQDIYLLWSQEEFCHILPHKEYFIDMLGHLDILVAPCDDILTATAISVNTFLVPCMINRPNNTKYLIKFCKMETTIILAYTFTEEVIPPAMVYRFVGYDIKNYKGRRMLFSDLVVCQVDDDHDIVVQVERNRLVVFLVHAKRKEDIEPTLASSIQEFLSAITSRITEFYTTLANDNNKSQIERFDEKPSDSRPYSIEYGVFCKKSSVCYFSHQSLLSSPQWYCQDHKKTHDVQSLCLWFAQKKAVPRCPESCEGLHEIELCQQPADKHIRRLVKETDAKTRGDIFFELNMPATDLDKLQIQFQHCNQDDMFCKALVQWRDQGQDSTFAVLEHDTILIISLVFREIEPDISAYIHEGEDVLNKIPTEKALAEFSNCIGNSTMHMALELDLKMSEIEEVQYKFPKMLKDQNKEILRLWRQRKSPKPTIHALIKAAHRIGKATYLPKVFLK